ncbi:glycoside hydrolase family 32 protein [Spiroplasma turonicum]|uniref:beta-fructofuranosidase n=1 Tax=Spiroplasma turonicum TaxID=216946 RepID=A0A0K1P798_9MOLU|nr:glycoside hydrolase family 32 protein [Spiroplasma turonicum]AKU79767.1 sucrose-6-phosphate hydrolase [Spiroplasma turonicum]ALX70785.1 sucrose-6-phosphate hydrolase [Spiroplasma turonicum]
MKRIKEIEWKKYNEIDKKYYEEANKLVESDRYYRPLYHIAPPNGLLNDPNGLLFKDGVHHIHYQWSPVTPYHGFKHWRYVTTKDFINYQDHGVSMIPDHEKEKYGSFSGSAYDFGDEVKIYWTGNMEDGKGEMTEEVQLVADFKNGNIINKKIAVEWDGNIFTPHARDPKIFEYNNKKYMVFGVRTKSDDLGGIALYEMIDYDKFKFKTVLKPSIKGNDYGYMWECPNLDFLNNQYLLVTSAEGYFNKDNKYELNSSRNVVYTILNKIDLDGTELNEKFAMKCADYGFDFYAPQTYRVNNKLVWYGWFGAVDVQYPTDEYSWHSMLTIPRELSIQNDILIQKPFEDFKNNILFNTKKQKSNSLNLEKAKHIKINLKDNLSFKIINDKNEYIEVKFTDDEIIMDRNNQTSKVDWDYENTRYAIRKIKNESQIIEIFIDSSSIELFADNYQTIFTSRFFVKDFNRVMFNNEIEFESSDIKPMILNK